jgi:hypothetical protein
VPLRCDGIVLRHTSPKKIHGRQPGLRQDFPSLREWLHKAECRFEIAIFSRGVGLSQIALNVVHFMLRRRSQR